jgi:small subunit ribosomal protein S1
VISTHRPGDVLEGTVTKVVAFGAFVEILPGVEGLVHISELADHHVENPSEVVEPGAKLNVKILEIDEDRRRLSLSIKRVEGQNMPMQGLGEQILGRHEPGQVVEGKISNIVDFGAFVDLDGMDGLIHISELSWSHVKHPSEVLEIGQTVNVKVLDIDRERQRISLGLKQTQSDPWQQVLDHYGEGDVVEGRVTKVVTFGAFVEILPGVEGLVHISELANHHVENPREVVSQGDPVNVLILEIDGDRRRLSLSLKRVEEGAVPVPRADGGESVHSMPDLRLSEEAFPSSAAATEDVEVAADADDEIVEGSLVVEDTEESAESETAPESEAEVEVEPQAEVEAEAPAEDEPTGEADAEIVAEAAPEPEPEADPAES